MPTWTVTDPETNEALDIEGDAEPTQQDVSELFSQHRASQTQKAGPSPAVAQFMGLGNAPSTPVQDSTMPPEPMQPGQEPQYQGGWVSMPKGVTSDTYFKGLPQKAGKEIGGMVQGIGALGGMALAASPLGEVSRQVSGANTGKEDLAAVANIAGSLPGAIGGAVKDLYHTVRYPVQSFYNRPIGTALDVATLGYGAAKGVGAVKGAIQSQRAGQELASKLMQSAADDPEDFARMINTLQTEGDLSGASGKTADAIAKAAEKLPIDDIQNIVGQTVGMENQARNLYAQIFTVPTKRARSLKPLDTSQKMLDYGITGNLDDLKRTADQVTNLVGGVNSDIVDQLPPVTFKDTNEVVDRLASQLTEITPDDVKKLKETIRLKVPVSTTQATNIPGGIQQQFAENMKRLSDKAAAGTLKGPRTQQALAGTGFTGAAGQAQGEALSELGDLAGTNPTNAMDVVRQLESRASQYRNASTYLTKNLRAEQLGELYQSAARSMENSVADLYGNANLLDAYKTPEFMQKLSEISPQLARDFARVKTFRQARSIMAPFMRLKELVDLSQEAQLSAAAKLGRNIGAAIGSAGAGALGIPGMLGSRLGPAGALGGMIGAPLVGPAINQAMTNIPGMTTRAAVQLPQTTAAIARAGLTASLPKIGAKAAATALPSAVIRKFMTQNKTQPPKTAYSQ